MQWYNILFRSLSAGPGYWGSFKYTKARNAAHAQQKLERVKKGYYSKHPQSVGKTEFTIVREDPKSWSYGKGLGHGRPNTASNPRRRRRNIGSEDGPMQDSVARWARKHIRDGKYIGSDLSAWGFKYRPGDSIPLNKQHDAMIEHHAALIDKVFKRSGRNPMKRRNPRKKSYQNRIKSWERRYIDSSGHYKGPNLQRMSYAPGDYVPVNKRYSAMSEFRYALSGRTLGRALKQRNPRRRKSRR